MSNMPSSSAAESVATVRIHYEIPQGLHSRAKQAAAKQGVTLKQFVETALEVAANAELGGRKGRKA